MWLHNGKTSTLGVEAKGVRRVVIRSGVVLEKDQGVLPSMMLPFRLFIGGPLGSGKQWVSWIHLDDLVQGMIYLLKNRSTSGAYNLTSPEPVTNATFGKTLGKVMHRPYWIPAPGFALKLALGEMSTIGIERSAGDSCAIGCRGFSFSLSRIRGSAKGSPGESLEQSGESDFRLSAQAVGYPLPERSRRP